MYNLDSFSYWKEPIVRINRIGIYPLDDEGREKYFSKDSFTHHYLRKIDPSFFKQIVMNTDINEAKNEKNENKSEPGNNQQSLNTISAQKEYEGLKKEPNQDMSQNFLKNNKTISSNANKNKFTLNQRYINNMNKKKKLNAINNFNHKSYSNSKKNKTLYSLTENKAAVENNDGKIAQSFDKSSRLTGLTVFKDRKPRVNLKLPLIMGGFNHENNNKIQMIRTGRAWQHRQS